MKIYIKLQAVRLVHMQISAPFHLSWPFNSLEECWLGFAYYFSV